MLSNSPDLSNFRAEIRLIQAKTQGLTGHNRLLSTDHG